MSTTPVFSPVSEKDVTRAIVRSYWRQFDELVESDVIIVGAGPSGLIAARDLAEQGFRVVVVERNNYMGGGFWVGGYFMNKFTLRAPAHEVLDELGVPYEAAGEELAEGLYVADAPHACCSLVAATYKAGAKFLNLTLLEDVILRNGRIDGVVINWSPILHLPKEMAALDPVPLEARVVIDGTGHDAGVVKKLAQRGLIEIPGEGALWIEKSEDAVVENTKEVFPGLVVTGMAVGPVFGIPRMGPTFGAMFLSGKRAAEVTSKILQK